MLRFALLAALIGCGGSFPPDAVLPVSPDAAPAPDTSRPAKGVRITAELVAAREQGIGCSWPNLIALSIADLSGVAVIPEAAPPILCPRVSGGETLSVGCHRIRQGIVVFWDWLEFELQPDGGSLRWSTEAGPLWCSSTWLVTSVALEH